MLEPRNGAEVYRHSLFPKAPYFARVDLRAPGTDGFPKSVRLATIEAVELIYIPPFWWHNIVNMEKATSINHWFAPANLNELLAAGSFYLRKIIGVNKYAWVKPLATDTAQTV